MSADEEPTPTARPRVLIPITIHFAVRYVVRTGLVARLAEECQPVLAFTWEDDDLKAQLEAKGYEVVRLPDAEVSPRAKHLFDLLEVHLVRRMKSPSPAIDYWRRSWNWTTRKKVRRGFERWKLRMEARRPGSEARVDKELHDTLDTETNVGEYVTFLRDLRIDAMVNITPFVPQEQIVLLAAERLELPRCTSILSFDNITTRPPLPVAFDRYLVWNRFMKEEILRGYPDTRPTDISLVGPAQFDFYRDPSLVVPEAEWRERLGIAPGAPTVLYGAGVVQIAHWETQYIDDLITGIDSGELPADLRIVLRRHPLDAADRWQRFYDHPAVAWDDPGRLGKTKLRPGQVDFDESAIVGLCSSLAHTDVHASASSTMTLDGACFDKPQIGPAYDTTGPKQFDAYAKALYDREHFIPIVASGGLELVYSPAELVAAVKRLLADPDSQRAGREKMLADMCTYTDGGNTARVAAGISAFLTEVVGDRR